MEGKRQRNERQRHFNLCLNHFYLNPTIYLFFNSTVTVLELCFNYSLMVLSLLLLIKKIYFNDFRNHIRGLSRLVNTQYPGYLILDSGPDINPNVRIYCYGSWRNSALFGVP